MSFGNGPWPPHCRQRSIRITLVRHACGWMSTAARSTGFHLPAPAAIDVEPAIAGLERRADRWRPVVSGLLIPAFDDRGATLPLGCARPGRGLRPRQMPAPPMGCSTHGSPLAQPISSRLLVVGAHCRLLGGLLWRCAAYVPSAASRAPAPRSARCAAAPASPLCGISTACSQLARWELGACGAWDQPYEGHPIESIRRGGLPRCLAVDPSAVVLSHPSSAMRLVVQVPFNEFLIRLVRPCWPERLTDELFATPR
jgi:hypothetical protein